MYHATILSYNIVKNPAPTAKEIQSYFKKSTRLLYGNDKRKSKSSPFPEKIHLVTSTFRSFKETFTSEEYVNTMLYVFDDAANSTMLYLKYADRVLCHFKLNETIADEMHNLKWNFDHLQSMKKGLQQNIGQFKFFKERGIGSKEFHSNAVPPFCNTTERLIAEVTEEMTTLEKKIICLYKSGWE